MYNCLVIGSGGHNLIRMIGCIDKLVTVNHLKLEEVKTIYATSAGAVLSAYLCLNLDWTILTKYLINKPWSRKYENMPSNLLSAFNDMGLFGDEFVHDILEIQFKMKGLNISTITLKELYEYSGKEINIYSFNLNKFECECFNYKTNPEMRVLDAVYMSSTFPFIFKPRYMNDSYYIDGGIHLDFPYIKALKDGRDKNKILSIKMTYPEREESCVKKNDNIIDLLVYMMQKFVLESRKNYEGSENPLNLILIKGEVFGVDGISNALKKENIESMIYEGRNTADKYLNDKIYKTDLINSVNVSTVGSASNSVTTPSLTK